MVVALRASGQKGWKWLQSPRPNQNPAATIARTAPIFNIVSAICTRPPSRTPRQLIKVKSTIVTTASGCAQVKIKSYGLPEKGTVKCQVKSGSPIAGIKKLEKRAKPAAIEAAELDSPTVECIQPKRNPQTGPSPFRKYAYCPPASGNAAPSSANDNAPNNDSNPPAIHAA